MKNNKINLQNNRLSRARFAGYCLPSLVILLVVMWLMPQVLDPVSGKGFHIPSFFSFNMKRTVTVFILIGCALVYYQHKLLEKRCNDAGLNWQIEEFLFKLGFVVASLGLLLRPLGLLVLGVVFAQFLYGIYLRDNWLPNLNGNPRRNDNFVLLTAATSYLVSIGLVLLSTQWLRTWFYQVSEGLKFFFWRLL
ncbi:MAG: hypothetical protein Q4A84_06750 [Neisseria sp.]|uniref:hypothetical protein n=1 Tax=Neisseria sp. TaxID=192066 RepID=UPI0026DDC819|nr:hypothetical protein [Neisseria sp.]MDO4641385.1 hypothetical protein [Neisseria sp.]